MAAKRTQREMTFVMANGPSLEQIANAEPSSQVQADGW